MKPFKLFILAIAVIFSAQVSAVECRKYTTEQLNLLHFANAIGYPEDLGKTLAAIVQKESFVGGHVVRINEKDLPYGSYGVTHVSLSTAMYLNRFHGSIWDAKANLIPRLITDDDYAIRMAMKKLKSVQSGNKWKKMVSLYNGQGPRADAYAEHVVKIVKSFKACSIFEPLTNNWS